MVTRALAGLRALSLQMAEDSGIDNPWVFLCCGCCCILCACTLCSRLITTALQNESPQPPPYCEAVPLMPLMDFPDQPDRADNEGGLEPTPLTMSLISPTHSPLPAQAPICEMLVFPPPSPSTPDMTHTHTAGTKDARSGTRGCGPLS